MYVHRTFLYNQSEEINELWNKVTKTVTSNTNVKEELSNFLLRHNEYTLVAKIKGTTIKMYSVLILQCKIQ